MVDPSGPFIGYAVTKVLDQVLKMIQESLAYREEKSKQHNHLLRIKPMVDAINSTAARSSAAPGTSTTTPQPLFDEATVGAVEVWLDQVNKLLTEAQSLLEICNSVGEGSRKKKISLKTRELSNKLVDLTHRIDKVLADSTLAALVKLDEIGKVLAQQNVEQKDLLLGTIQEFKTLMGEMQSGHSGALAANPNVAGNHPLGTALKTLARTTKLDRRCRVKVEIADLTGARRGRFRPPTEIESGADQRVSDDRGRAVGSGYDVNNDTSIRLTIAVTWLDPAWYFYVISCNETAADSQPELIYPLTMPDYDNDDGDQANRLTKRNGPRVFPCKEDYDDDPPSVKLTRTHNNNAPVDACDRVSLFLLVIRSCLTPDHKPTQEITMEDFDRALNKPHDDAIIVKQFQFHIRPALP